MNKGFGRNKVQPIREITDLENCIAYLKKKNEEANPRHKFSTDRNLTMFYNGINTALRISDLRRLKPQDIKTGYLCIREKKTKKVNQIVISSSLMTILENYIKRWNIQDNEYLYKSEKGMNKPITEVQAWRIMKDIQDNLKLNYPIGTHTLRKTFGYHFYQKTKDIVTLKEMLNHDDANVTLIYIGIVQKNVDKARKEFKIGI